ncbi:hypothetical protein AGOR_G00143580 [Albula goreensis]|uniref:3-hydroxybutyrate dehydrogenase, type 1 n=1 Tax=Albula goreensis TaxID=1534307 RepID=A0A8T3D736_9TELE|nr:hypothetical protein AGOR_G00143580 [Albula goreensis]
MAPLPIRRVIPLVLFSLSLTFLLGFGVPSALNFIARCCGFPEAGMTECIVLVYLFFVCYEVLPPIPRGTVKVHGKAVLVTGCDSGFGFVLAKHLHELGFSIFAGCRLKDEMGEGSRGLEMLHSDRMKVLQLDVLSDQQVARAVEFVGANLEDPEKGLWAVVNSAEVCTFGEVEFVGMETYKHLSEVNLWGTVRVTKALLPLIRRAKGRVVNVSSMFGRMGGRLHSPYCVSKYGVEAFSDCLRYEMKPWGVKVIVIEPGNFVEPGNPMTRDIMDATANKRWQEAGPRVQEDYGKTRFEQHISTMRSYCSYGQKDTTPFLNDVTDAVRSCRPFARYCPMVMRWWIRMQVITHLPTTISDWL